MDDTQKIGFISFKPPKAPPAFSDIAHNRTLIGLPLTNEDPIDAEIVKGLESMKDVFTHYKPEMKVEYEDAEGVSHETNLTFSGMSDFGPKGIIAKSPLLQELDAEASELKTLVKRLQSNKPWQKLLSDPEGKTAYLDAVKAIIAELEAADPE